MNVVPNQKTRNANYVVSANARVLAGDSTDVFEPMCQRFENGRLHYQQQAQNARQLGRLRAAFDLAELIWSLALSREQEQLTL